MEGASVTHLLFSSNDRQFESGQNNARIAQQKVGKLKIMKAIGKNIGSLIVGCIFACLTSNLHAQTSPKLKIAKDSPASVQINWTNIVGTSYRVLFTSNLTGSGLLSF